MDKYETDEKDGFKLEISFDPDPESPREWDNIGILALGGRGQKHLSEIPFEFDGREADLERLKEEHNAIVILPVYKYDHSGVAYSTSPFGCPWDSGQVGWIFATAESLTKIQGAETILETNGKPLSEGISDDFRKTVEEWLTLEIETFSDWAEGNVYGYVITDSEENAIDSCWGYYGDEGLKSIRENFVETVEYLIEKRNEEQFPLFLATGVEIPAAAV